MTTIQKSAIGTAPGKLDFLGGFPESHGSLTLQVQTEAKTTVLATECSDLIFGITSTQQGQFQMDVAPLKALVASQPDNAAIRQWLDEMEVPAWARFVTACLILFHREFSWTPARGISFAISTDVPVGIGIGSSAALEVATLHALQKISSHYYSDRRLGEAATELEREVIGNKSDIVTQLSAAYGKPGYLIPISSRSDPPLPLIELPKGVTIVGWSSSSNDNSENAAQCQAVCRAAKIANAIAKNALNEDWQYPTDIVPSRYFQDVKIHLPKSLTGEEITLRYPELAHGLSLNTNYNIRDAFSFSLFENHRCSLAAQLLTNMAHNSKRRVVELLGELMLQSHANYSRLGLTNKRIDSMVRAFAELGPENGIFGARISSSGTGSAMVALVDKKSLKNVRDLLRSFTTENEEPVDLIR